MTLVSIDDRTEWLLWRRRGVGASDVAGILGISRWSSPWSVWADKVGLLPLDDRDTVTPEQEAGQWLELAIGPWFADRTGHHVACWQQRCEHPDDAIARCTLDGRVWASADEDADDELGGLEIKTAERGRPWSVIPEQYQAQGQWQMHVTGLDRIYFPVLMGRRLDLHELERDQADIDFMVDRVHQFWAEHVVTGTPPPTDGSDATLEAIEKVYPHHVEGKSVDLDHLVFDLGAWRDAKAAQKRAEDEVAQRRAAITAALGEAEEGLVGGVRAVTWREQTSKRRCPHPGCGDDECEGTKTSTFRVLRDAARKEKSA